MTIGEPTMTQAEIERWERDCKAKALFGGEPKHHQGTIPHGTANGYGYWRCRCILCCEANTERMREYVRKRRNDHAHRWRVEEPGGPTSRGVCECGAEREFANAFVMDREGGNANAMRQSTNYVARKGAK